MVCDTRRKCSKEGKESRTWGGFLTKLEALKWESTAKDSVTHAQTLGLV